jgi:ribosomal subunit interface protein
MKLQIVARHLPLTDTLRDHVRRRFLEILPRHFDRESCELHVELSGGPKHRYAECRARLTVPGGLLVVSERAPDLYAAVDAAERTLLRKVMGWRDRVLIGTRFPKKYFVARRLEESEELPAPTEAEAALGEEE